MTTPNKYREFWIHDITTESNGELPVAFSHHKPKPSTHVIEHSALLAEQKKCEQWKAIAIEMREYLEYAESALFKFNCDAPLELTQEPHYLRIQEGLAKFDQRVEEMG